MSAMVRIVRTDGSPTNHVDPLPLADACRHAKEGRLGAGNGFYQAEFVEPAPLFDVVTYTRARGPSGATPLDDGARRVPLAKALTIAAEEREADEDAGIGVRWRTVVRAAR